MLTTQEKVNLVVLHKDEMYKELFSKNLTNDKEFVVSLTNKLLETDLVLSKQNTSDVLINLINHNEGGLVSCFSGVLDYDKELLESYLEEQEKDIRDYKKLL